MGASWPLQKAKNQFSKVVDLALSEGPQTVTRHGKPVVVVSAMKSKDRSARRPGTGTRLLALIRRCPVDLTALTKRDSSAPRGIDLR